MKLAFIASIVVAALAAFFAVQNAQVAKVSFLGWYFEASLVMVMAITFVAGVLATILIMIPASLKKSLEIKRLKAHMPHASPAPPAPTVPPALQTGARDEAANQKSRELE
jgi:uncharacterized integral membrane protein